MLSIWLSQVAAEAALMLVAAAALAVCLQIWEALFCHLQSGR
jgi:hypothetical protein